MDIEDLDKYASRVCRLTSAYVDLWNNETDGIPRCIGGFTHSEQLENERKLGVLLPALPESLMEYECLEAEERTALRFRLQKKVAEFSLPGGGSVTDQFFESSGEMTDAFIRAARQFDPSLCENEIRQALRNFWVFNSIQVLLGRAASQSPSSFAYSLLYPYTDNGLDRGSGGKEEPSALLLWLNGWFAGEMEKPSDPLTSKIARLLMMIEGEYPRSAYPSVFESLRAIHRAQEKSVALHDPAPGTPEPDLLAITMEKGGTSVVVDGMLVRGSLRDRQEEALFGFGVLLQLIDDLQDIGEDRLAGHSTPFVRAIVRNELEAVTCRLIHLTTSIIALMKKRLPSKHPRIHDIIERSSMLLIAGAVARYHNHYTEDFLNALEQTMPYRLEYLARLNHTGWPLKTIGILNYANAGR